MSIDIKRLSRKLDGIANALRYPGGIKQNEREVIQLDLDEIRRFLNAAALSEDCINNCLAWHHRRERTPE